MIKGVRGNLIRTGKIEIQAVHFEYPNKSHRAEVFWIEYESATKPGVCSASLKRSRSPYSPNTRFRVVRIFVFVRTDSRALVRRFSAASRFRPLRSHREGPK
jgi:hypothetical protein